MKKGYINLLIINSLFILLLILNNIFNVLNIYTLILFLIITLFIVLEVLGYERSNYRYQKDVILTVLIYSSIYIIITNLLGLFVGFNKTLYSLKFLSILKNIFPIMIVIILSEVIRYIIVKKGNKYKTNFILVVIVFVLFDITLIINSYNFKLVDEFINFLNSVILPSISKNIMLVYIVYKVGYKPAILYRIIFELQLYILPIIPDFGIYIGTILQIVSPPILFYIFYNNFEKTKAKKIIIKKTKLNYEKISFIISSALMLIIIATSSGWFKYQSLTIASESMTGSINKGDIVIIRKLNSEEMNFLREGDILVFRYSGKIIVHRIIRVHVASNDFYFYTKGDFNKTEDGYPIEKDDIIGTTFFRIPYLGYPSAWLNELMR